VVDVSIIIPFKNEFIQLTRCIQGILNQQIQLNFEIIILDSSDNSLQIEIQQLSEKIKYFRILPNSFNHGFTRNEGVNFANGKVLVFTVQDSIAVDSFWLTNLVQPLLDNKLDAICGTQISNASEDTNPIWWHRPIDKPSIRFVDITSIEFNNLQSQEKKEYSGWDNVNAAYLKESLVKIPFRTMMFGEDAQWAVDAINSDLKLAYTAFSSVYHDHPFDFNFAVRRTLAEYYTRKKTIDLDPVRPKLKLITILKWFYLLTRTTKSPFKILYWFKVSMQQVFAEKEAYKKWVQMGFTTVENFLVYNVPMSKK
jgi:rhamnosyltransferase